MTSFIFGRRNIVVSAGMLAVLGIGRELSLQAGCGSAECRRTSCYRTIAAPAANSCKQYDVTSAELAYDDDGGGTRDPDTGFYKLKTGAGCAEDCAAAMYDKPHGATDCDTVGTWTEWGNKDNPVHKCTNGS